MRLAPAARRTVATVAATTLLTAGGVLTGALVGVASAQAVSSVSPTNVLNNGAKTFTLNGSGFVPGAMTVVLHRHVTVAGQGDVKGTFAACAGLTCTTTESFSAPLANVAPGVYDVVLTNTATSEVDKLASAVTVTAVGSPTLTSVAHYVNGTTPADGDLELTGTNLSQGSVVQFLKADGTVDSGLSFTPSLGTTSGYVSSTTLRGHYTATTAATPGLHALKVVDAVNQSSNTLAFYQPQLDGTSQPTIGQGANAAALSVLGQGFNPSSTYTISTPSTPDLTVSSPVSVTSTSVTENVTVKANAATTARTITVRGPDGGFATRSDLLSITAGPAFSAGPPLATAPLNPSVRGQGSTTDVVVTGSGFTGGTTFDFGPGTSSPRPVKTFTSSTSVVVTVPVADTAPTGTRNVVATNADDGTSTLASGFTVTAAPRASRLSPASGNRGQSAVTTLVDGTGFVSGDSYTVTFSGAPGEITTSTAHYVSATELSVPVSVSSSAPSGARDVTVTDTTDGGTSTCAACYGINSLSVTPTSATNSATNSGPQTLTLNGSGLDGTTTVRVYLPGQIGPAYQADLAGTSVTSTGQDTVTASVDLTDAATGTYSVETTTGGATLLCTGCLTVLAPNPPSLSGITPINGGQGATARQVRIDGSYLYPGTSVTFSGPGVTATGVTWHPADADNPQPYIVASVAITDSATVNDTVAGARDVTVTNLGDGTSGTLPQAFTVDQQPLPTAISPATLGQGAVQDVTVSGTRFQDGSTADFGPGTSAVLKSYSGNSATGPTTLVYSVTVAPNAPTGAHDVTVVAPDEGRKTLVGALTVTPAPVVSALTPSVGAPGTSRTVTVDATGLQQGVTVTIGDLTVGSTTLAQDGQSLTVSVTVPAGASLGKRDLTLTNPDGGTSTFGSTAGQSGFVVATVPAAPTGVSVTTGNGSATVTWSAPSTDGGSPVTSYVVGDGDSGTPNQVVQAGQARTATFTGLTNGRTYTFSVTAANAVGTGPAGTRQGTPYTVPSAPTTVTATPQDAQVALAWSPAAANGSGVTGYLVHETAGKVPDISLGAVTSTVVTGLTNGSAYSFQVRARNAAGNGAFSAATAAVTPRYATVLTSKRYPSATTVAGTTVHYLGRLSRSRTGAALSGARVTLSLRPGVGSTVTVALTTDAYGNWSYYAKPVYNTYASARFGGDSVDAPASAASYLKLVAPRITVTSPRNGSSSGAGTVLVVKGTISPNKSGKRLELYRVLSGGKLQPIAAATVSRTSTWQFSIKPSRGTYVFRVGIGGTTGNAGALSSAFKVYRT